MEKIGVVLIGAGVAGLAIAEELTKYSRDILVIEKEPAFGQGTSSRNSEVIHAGIYYPQASLKAKTCIEGSSLLYEFCSKHDIAHKRIGKLIVAIDKSELKDLERLYKRALDNGVKDLAVLTKKQIREIEPHVEAEAAIYSPSTGILDTHGFMKILAAKIESRGGLVAYNTEVVGIDKKKDGFEVKVEDRIEGSFIFSARLLINCAGLYSDKIAAMAGIKKDEYSLKYCKGDYFRVANQKAKFINRLIYPVPKEDRAGLGIHATLDLGGGLRLGPDDEYVDKIDYRVDESKKKAFYESVRVFLPFINLEDISPDTAGIRPKLQGKGEKFRDFVIKDESDNGLSGLINLIGIESPGLTSSLSIAKITGDMARHFLR